MLLFYCCLYTHSRLNEPSNLYEDNETKRKMKHPSDFARPGFEPRCLMVNMSISSQSKYLIDLVSTIFRLMLSDDLSVIDTVLWGQSAVNWPQSTSDTLQKISDRPHACACVLERTDITKSLSEFVQPHCNKPLWKSSSWDHHLKYIVAFHTRKSHTEC